MDSAMGAVGDWVAARLSDYRKNFEDAGPIPGLLEVLLSSQRCLGRQADVGQVKGYENACSDNIGSYHQA